MMAFRTLPGVLHGLTLVASPEGLREIRFGCEGAGSDEKPALLEAERQLREYFAGNRFAFDLRLDLAGTPFQRAVWDAVAAIPYGETRSYREIAHVVGRPKGYRAMGQANGRNPAAHRGPVPPRHQYRWQARRLRRRSRY